MREFFYRPEDAWAADFIPFYDGSAFRLFYLLDWRDREGHGEGTPWFQVSTPDFVHFTEHGEMLPRGTVDEQDLYVFTGSVIEAEGQYHIFYTGHNPHFRQQGKPEQAVMHAISDDLLHWRKVPEDTFFAPEGYEPHDWRDPFVFWEPQAKEWQMLLAARKPTGPSRRRGLTALCASKDLKTWEVREPFWSPGLYFTHECPDLFQMGDWYYLVFSEFSEGSLTRYRMSRSLSGPWLTPADDCFDGRPYYAAKSVSDGQRRFLFGWNATREGNQDYRNWQWGGNLVVHEIVQQADGTLSVRVPDTIDRTFGQATAFTFAPGVGKADFQEDVAVLDATGAFACVLAGTMPDRCKIETTVTFDAWTRACGLMLRADDNCEATYYIRLEPDENRIVFDSWPRAWDIPYMIGLSRPFVCTPGRPVELKVFVDGTVCEIYVGGKVALSARMYNLSAGQWGLFASEGTATFSSTRLSLQSPLL